MQLLVTSDSKLTAFLQRYSTIVLTLCLLTAAPLHAQQTYTKSQVLPYQTTQIVQINHFNPKSLNNVYSEQAFKMVLKRMDPSKRFFLQSDIDTLKQYQYTIDTDIKEGETTLFKSANSILNRRSAQIQALYPSLLNKPFSFNTHEVIELDGEKRPFVNTMDELKDRWKNQIKYQVLQNYIHLLETEKIATGNTPSASIATTALPKFDPKLEEKARQQVKKNLDRQFKRLGQETDEDRLARYVDALLNIYDPHTNYFAPQKKEDFDISLSGKLEGIGAVLREEDIYIKVVRVVPGSAAWRQGQLKEEDTILKVAQGNTEPVDITDMRVEDAVKLIRGKKGTEVRLTVKKPNGSIQIIPIIRDVVVLEDTYARSAIIQNDTLKGKYGYIYLPGFYRDFDDSNARNAADDVKKELLSLKKEKVKGIILDMRNNGGGSLEDAIKMTGHFIKTGPVVQVKNRFQSAPYEDNDPTIVYDGPLIILINQFSASASEIVAGALKDYGRALIMGSEHTYGKGTVQTFKNLDETIRGHNYLKPLGSIKITIQQFFRINGESTQFQGVKSDIVLPMLTDYLKVGEKELEYALPFQAIPPVSYRKWSPAIPISSLKEKSRRRVQDNPKFNLIQNYITKRKKDRESTTESLRLDQFYTHQQEIEKESQSLKILDEEVDTFKISLPPDSELAKANYEESEAKRKEFKKSIRKDSVIHEAVYILNDWN